MSFHVLELIFWSPIHSWLMWFICMSANILSASSSSIDWLKDGIEIAVTSSTASFTLSMSASRHVLPSTSGHFKLRVVANGVEANTSCISYGASDSEVSEVLVALDPVDDLGGVSVVREGNGSSAFGYGYKYHISSTTSTDNIEDIIDIKFLGRGMEFGCSKIMTRGYWDDRENWETKTVPGSDDEVNIPADSGYIVLGHHTHVSALEMRGGALVTHSSTCLPDWTPAPVGISVSFANKCYRLFVEASPWVSAQATCASAVSSPRAGSHRGALRGALVTVRDLDEEQWITRLCRGDTASRDCWVGVARHEIDDGVGHTITSTTTETAQDPQHRLLAWNGSSRLEDEGKRGRHCPAMRAPSGRASDQEQARWSDADCESEKPFVCQAFGVTRAFSLTVSKQLRVLGGYIIGSGTVISASVAQVSDDSGEFGLLQGTTLINSGAMEWSVVEAVGWGGTLENQGLLTFAGLTSLSASRDSEGYSWGNAEAWPLLLNQRSGSVFIHAESTVDLQWLFWNEGGQVQVEGMLHASGGGYTSGGNLVIDPSGELMFSNCSFKMHQSEAIEVTLQADREVTARDVEDPSDGGGYYRLAFAGEDSRCIGYHATAEDLQMILEELDVVHEAGGVTVTREGDGRFQASHFGYRYIVILDGGRNLSLGSDSRVSVTLSCVGSAVGCDCTDVTGQISGPGGSRMGCGSAIFGAENVSTSAHFSEAHCIVQAWVGVKPLRRGGETIVSGGGALVFSGGGQYMLPSVVEANVHVLLGAEVVCAQWEAKLRGAINASRGGVLWFAGGDWDALDAVRLLHAAPKTLGRNATSVAFPPPFNATVIGNVMVTTDAQIRLAATPSSTLDIAGILTLRGGCLSGSGRLRVREEIIVLSSPINVSHGALDTPGDAGTVGESPSSLRDALLLDLSGGGHWIGGDVHVLDGVTVINRGRFKMTAKSASFGENPSVQGQSHLHFDGIGWYINPLCGEKCMAEPMWQNAAGGELLVEETGSVRLCFTLLNEGVVTVEDGSLLEVCGSGEARGTGTFHLPGTNSTLRISAGKSRIEARANVTGEGVLEFSGGQGHELAEVMLPLVKVSGDTAVNFPGTSLLLGRGLIVTDKATIHFSAVATTIFIEGDLTLSGDGMVTFPGLTVEDSLLKPALGFSPPWGDEEGHLDGDNGLGASSRSICWVQGNFLWTGGTFDGNARLVSTGESIWLEVDTTSSGNLQSLKRLANSFHLVNQGDINWYHGDVILSAGAAFVNRGTLRLLNDAATSERDGQRDYMEGPRIRAPRQGDQGRSKTSERRLPPFAPFVPFDTVEEDGGWRWI